MLRRTAYDNPRRSHSRRERFSSCSSSWHEDSVLGNCGTGSVVSESLHLTIVYEPGESDLIIASAPEVPVRTARVERARTQRFALCVPSTWVRRLRVIATTRGSGVSGASGDALGTGSRPSSQPSVPVSNTIALDGAV